MGRFDDFVDEFVFMARNAADVAGKKTGEVVELGRLKYQIKQAEWDIERAYAKLGAIVYESRRGAEDLEDAVKLAIEEIDDIRRKINHLEESVRAFKKVKKCAKCERENALDASFCVRCGAVLEDVSESAEAEGNAEDPAEEPIDF